MKVYVVTDGSYSDYHIVSIFSTKEKADIHAALLNSSNYQEANVEEWDVDDIEINTNQKIIDYAIVYYGTLNGFNDNVIRTIQLCKGLEGKISFSKSIDLVGDGHQFVVRADTIEKAKKIFYDKYAEAMNNYLIELRKEKREE